ncbi:MAG TPA: glycosyltransferase family 39 protein [Candidatus Angelobacter sp.]|nr:glycosyltransferase family 39 protein [Candidatus Angelobacter sp.]
MATLLLNKPAPAATQRFLHSSRSADSFRLERRLALMLIAVAAIYLRFWNPLYSTAYMDESVYVVYGRMFFARHFEAPLDTPLQWSFGWYLWPAMAALADRIGGLLAVRELAAGLGVITVAATYGFASRVFSKPVGIVAALAMSLLAPAVLVSRIATRDSGSVCFFALGLWAFAVAWEGNKKRHWALAAALFFAAFLCKYLVAIYFPLLVVLALFKRWKGLLCFAAPLFVGCAAYAVLHRADLIHLLTYGGAYGSLRAPDAVDIYVWRRWDFWLITIVGLAAFASLQWRIRAIWMWVGALAILVFQWKSRADYDYWKHVNYALLFLVPLAAAGIVFLVRKLLAEKYSAQLLWGTAAALALAFGAGWLGRAQSIERFVFWPNVDPILAYFENRLTAQDRVLVDDTVFRYYFHPPLSQHQIVDPMYFYYHDGSGRDLFGEEAYKTAVAEGAFTYVVLDGGIGEEARRLNNAIRPALGRYTLLMGGFEPTLGQRIEIYGKADSQPATTNSNFRISEPASNAIVDGGTTTLRGMATQARPGSFALVEVFTDRWYRQGEYVPIAADGTFSQKVYLGGQGKQQCSHLVRARLYDSRGHAQAVAMNYGIVRGGGPIECGPSAQ